MKIPKIIKTVLPIPPKHHTKYLRGAGIKYDFFSEDKYGRYWDDDVALGKVCDQCSFTIDRLSENKAYITLLLDDVSEKMITINMRLGVIDLDEDASEPCIWISYENIVADTKTLLSMISDQKLRSFLS